jgi:type I site-specific restriction-modification system R (restriction) subunit
MQGKNIKECVLDTISDLVRKVQKRARKPWITQEMLNKVTKEMEECIQQRRKNHRRLTNELKTTTHKSKKEYLKSICYDIMEFQRTGRYDLMYMKSQTLRLKRKPQDSKQWH